MDYCCEAFEAHVKHGFFVPADFPPDSSEYKLYKDAKWMTGLVGVTKAEDGAYRFELHTDEWNLAPITYCLFCGSKLAGGSNE